MPLVHHASPSPPSTRGLPLTIENCFCLISRQSLNKAPPDYIVVENVPGLGSVVGKEIYQRFRAILERMGFRMDADFLDAKQFGVPQTRKRFILVASRHAALCLPEPTTRSQFKTVGDAIPRNAAYPRWRIVRQRQESHRKRIAPTPSANRQSRSNQRRKSARCCRHIHTTSMPQEEIRALIEMSSAECRGIYRPRR